MTREEAIAILIREIDEDPFIRTEYRKQIHEALNMGIEALEQEHCKDAISRQAVLDIAKSSKSNWIDNSVLFKRVNELPSVTPKLKTGRWIFIRMDPIKFNNEYECSECGRRIRCTTRQLVNYPYCHCGAKMENGEMK